MTGCRSRCHRPRTYAVATILGMERLTEAGRQIVAFVIDARGQIQGYQTKNQLDPSEDRFYEPGKTRRVFDFASHSIRTRALSIGVSAHVAARLWAAR